MHKLILVATAAVALTFLGFGRTLAGDVPEFSKAECEIRYSVCAQSCNGEVPSLKQKCLQVCRSNKYRCLKNAS